MHTILHVSAWFQNEAPSSIAKSTPPMGAPKAAATPAAAPRESRECYYLTMIQRWNALRTQLFETLVNLLTSRNEVSLLSIISELAKESRVDFIVQFALRDSSTDRTTRMNHRTFLNRDDCCFLALLIFFVHFSFTNSYQFTAFLHFIELYLVSWFYSQPHSDHQINSIFIVKKDWSSFS